MKDEKKRTLYLKVRVSPEEMAAIKKKFALILLCKSTAPHTSSKIF